MYFVFYGCLEIKLAEKFVNFLKFHVSTITTERERHQDNDHTFSSTYTFVNIHEEKLNVYDYFITFFSLQFDLAPFCFPSAIAF